MPHDPRAWLWDVREAAAAIAEFTAGMDAAAYAENRLVRSAVERQFEIIGEALNRLSRDAPALAARIPDLAAIVAFRNTLIHGYASVDDAIVWRNIEENLPTLSATVAAMLDDAGTPGP
ncbi:MAG: DUF86 domain-containing protein [Rhodobacteraceae bacterium]|jgi:uncharacterized protein with HEPN domain|nr:DUF86 domain-containing protein [Paracoccaceae bacterium]MBL4558989.1 DUF86 domain-containing protein [Paracoccaceae bacterium]